MNHTEAKVLKKSVAPDGTIISTFQIIAPQVIHAELIRHRAMSYSILSLRAVGKQRVVNDKLFIPTDVRYNEKGMSGYSQLTDEDYDIFEEWYLGAHEKVKNLVSELEVDAHKQTVNRLLTPFRFFQAIVTSTSFGLNNFFSLRLAPNAQPEIQDLAVKMKKAFDEAPIQQLSWGDWHIPFESDAITLEEKIKVSCTRAARTSYGLYENASKMSIEEEVAFANKLVTDRHFSALEHCAMAVPAIPLYDNGRIHKCLMRNFDNFVPYRTFAEEQIPVYVSVPELYTSFNLTLQHFGFVTVSHNVFISHNWTVTKLSNYNYVAMHRFTENTITADNVKTLILKMLEFDLWRKT